MATDNTKFLGFERSQLPLIALMLTLAGIIISIQIGMMAIMNANMNANDAALRAEMTALRAEVNANDDAYRAELAALRADMNAELRAVRAEIDTLRSDMNASIYALDSRVDALALEMGEMNGRVKNIEGYIQTVDTRIRNTETLVAGIELSLPDYGAIDTRLDALELGQTTLTDRLDALAAAAPPE